MIRKSTLALAFSAATVIASLAAPAQAASFNLGNLISTGGSFQVGDKVFKNFTCNISFTGVASPNNCNSINVRTVDSDPFGIQFQAGFSAGSRNRSELSTLTAILGYDIEVAPNSDYVLSATRLRFNGAASPAPVAAGDVITKVTQTVKDLSNNTLATAEVTNPPVNLNDREELNDYVSKARVENILEIQAKNNKIGAVSFVENRFEQTEVPEPGTVGGLLALGSIGVGVMLKKKGKSNDSTSFPPADNNN